MAAQRYSEEFKQDAVSLVGSTGRSINSVARGLGVNTESLRQWVRAVKGPAVGAGGEAMTPAEREELKRLGSRSANWSWRRKSFARQPSGSPSDRDRLILGRMGIGGSSPGS
ncbi:transposase [Streptomyces sp. YC504]|uniref:Transposase n=1 Tax=Streptomyces mesophilus TaxID=1775132 RepID=A0A6G4XDE1_9ACTN|nr:transposase [Streptomyces mesophilus]